MNQQMVMYEDEFKQIAAVCERLTRQANARAVLLIDKNGQYITGHGESVGNLDTTSLATLAASNVAATSGLAKLIGEKEFPNQFHEGERDNLHLSIVAEQAILVVLFDQRSSLGLVRLRLKKSTEELTRIFNTMIARAQSRAQATPFAEITDSDIDNLFRE
jgi:predicted regulator of Ras-like GTPase activity (Roadblock/LC7/MglB family)